MDSRPPPPKKLRTQETIVAQKKSPGQESAVENGPPKLPLELIYRVLETQIPSTAVALAARDSRIRLFHAFLLVCRGTYLFALRLLFSHGLYIDSPDRLHGLLRSLITHISRIPPDSGSGPGIKLKWTPEPSTLPITDVRPCLQNLYLSPFVEDSLRDIFDAQAVFVLFQIASPTLRRLVIVLHLEYPFRMWQAIELMNWLFDALSTLTAIEEFVWIGHPILSFPYYVFGARPVFWTGWRNLRCLSMGYNSWAPDLTKMVASLTGLTRLESILIHNDSLTHPGPWTNIFDSAMLALQQDIEWIVPLSTSERALDQADWILKHIAMAKNWNDNKPGKAQNGQMKFCWLILNETSSKEHILNDTKFQKWLEKTALEGELWGAGRARRFRESTFHPDVLLDADLSAERWMSDDVEFDRASLPPCKTPSEYHRGRSLPSSLSPQSRPKLIQQCQQTVEA